eukprot:5410974-Amphidinium_carterae.1
MQREKQGGSAHPCIEQRHALVGTAASVPNAADHATEIAASIVVTIYVRLLLEDQSTRAIPENAKEHKGGNYAA